MDHRERRSALFDTRRAVRETLAAHFATTGEADRIGAPAPLVLVALSGGADSLALAAATAFETGASGGSVADTTRGVERSAERSAERNAKNEGSARRAAKRAAASGLDGVRAGAVVVDHGLQEGSAQVAERAAAQARGLGLDPVLVRRVEVPEPGGQGGAGREGAAREARYAALAQTAEEVGAEVILIAHTRDDQAEQVILSLVRGSGTRSVAGIPPKRELAEGVAILRPFLAADPQITRATTEGACAAESLEFWRDPHNDDPAYARVRVRARVLPQLERELGPGVAAALARTADLAREDAEALDALAEDALGHVTMIDEDPASSHKRSESAGLHLSVPGLAALPAALRHRVIRLAAQRTFGAHLSREHTLAVDALVTDWRGQGPIDVPRITSSRQGERLSLRPRVSRPESPLAD